MKPYVAKNYTHLLGLAGLSDALLKNHFALYEGYVTNTEKLADLITDKEPGTPEYAELTRRFGWEWNGMRLHELYFDNLTKTSAPLKNDASLTARLSECFGSPEVWEVSFRAIGALRGIGWAILSRDNETGRLFNTWVDEHNTGHLAGATPLLVMDVFEHAYISDYGIKRADYIETFFRSVDWAVVEKRLL